MKRFREEWASFFASFFIFVFLLPARSEAQDMPTALRTMDISVFQGFETVNTGYANPRNNGVLFGANVTRYFGFPIAPSLEARLNIANGSAVNEHTYLFGLRAQETLFQRYHPYANLLLGPGTVHSNYSTYEGKSIVYSYGAGVDIDIYSVIQAKLDFQGQHWNLGQPGVLKPTVVSIGIAYHFH